MALATWEFFWLAGSWSTDTTAPVPNVTVGPSAAKISRISGKDSITFTFQSDEDYVEYKVKGVPDASSPHTAGNTIETATGTWTANTDHNITLTDEEVFDTGTLSEGTHVIKVFVKDAAGNWST